MIGYTKYMKIISIVLIILLIPFLVFGGSTIAKGIGGFILTTVGFVLYAIGYIAVAAGVVSLQPEAVIGGIFLVGVGSAFMGWGEDLLNSMDRNVPYNESEGIVSSSGVLKIVSVYPDPFKPVSDGMLTIEYSLSRSIDNKIGFKVLNSNGQEIYNEIISVGQVAGNFAYQWTGYNNDGKLVSGGTYIIMFVIYDNVNHVVDNPSTTLHINNNDSPAIIKIITSATEVEEGVSISLSAIGGYSHEYSWKCIPEKAGYFTPPEAEGANVSFTATNSDSSKVTIFVEDDCGNIGRKQIQVKEKETMQITTTTLPTGNQYSEYTASFSAVGGTHPYHWEISEDDEIPAGLSIWNDEGKIKGVPLETGSFSFLVRVYDEQGNSGTKRFTLNINNPANNYLYIVTGSSSLEIGETTEIIGEVKSPDGKSMSWEYDLSFESSDPTIFSIGNTTKEVSPVFTPSSLTFKSSKESGTGYTKFRAIIHANKSGYAYINVKLMGCTACLDEYYAISKRIIVGTKFYLNEEQINRLIGKAKEYLNKSYDNLYVRRNSKSSDDEYECIVDNKIPYTFGGRDDVEMFEAKYNINQAKHPTKYKELVYKYGRWGTDPINPKKNHPMLGYWAGVDCSGLVQRCLNFIDVCNINYYKNGKYKLYNDYSTEPYKVKGTEFNAFSDKHITQRISGWNKAEHKPWVPCSKYKKGDIINWFADSKSPQHLAIIVGFSKDVPPEDREMSHIKVIHASGATRGAMRRVREESLLAVHDRHQRSGRPTKGFQVLRVLKVYDY